MQNLLLSPIDTDALVKMIADKVTANVLETLNKQPDHSTTDQSNFITPKEASELLKVSPVTLWRYQKSGKLKLYGIGGKRLYKRDEIINSLTLKK